MNEPLRITYPTGWLLAVANTDVVAERGRARAELAGAGDVLLLNVAGPSVATLAKPGLFSRLMNLLRHLSTDQAADLIV